MAAIMIKRKRPLIDCILQELQQQQRPQKKIIIRVKIANSKLPGGAVRGHPHGAVECHYHHHPPAGRRIIFNSSSAAAVCRRTTTAAMNSCKTKAMIRRSIKFKPILTLEEDFIFLGKQLGSGGQGVVSLCQEKHGARRTLACKSPLNIDDIIDKEEWNDSVRQEFWMAKALEGIDGALHIEGLVRDGQGILHLLMEFCDGGDLFSRLQSSQGGTMKEQDAARVVQKLAQTLAACHARRIMHRDVKLENVLFVHRPSSRHAVLDYGAAAALVQLDHQKISHLQEQEEQVVLADFGMALRLDDDAHHQGRRHDNKGSSDDDDRYYAAGTSMYMAPEVIAAAGPSPAPSSATSASRHCKINGSQVQRSSTYPYDERADVWSLGVLLHALLMGTFPFPGETDDEVLTSIRTLTTCYGDDLRPYLRQLNMHLSSTRPCCEVSERAIDLLAGMLRTDPRSRLTMQQIRTVCSDDQGRSLQLIKEYVNCTLFRTWD